EQPCRGEQQVDIPADCPIPCPACPCQQRGQHQKDRQFTSTCPPKSLADQPQPDRQDRQLSAFLRRTGRQVLLKHRLVPQDGPHASVSRGPPPGQHRAWRRRRSP